MYTTNTLTKNQIISRSIFIKTVTVTREARRELKQHLIWVCSIHSIVCCNKNPLETQF